jgi:hypothetical protein
MYIVQPKMAILIIFKKGVKNKNSAKRKATQVSWLVIAIDSTNVYPQVHTCTAAQGLKFA